MNRETEGKITAIVAIVALAISGFSLIISFKSCAISEKSFSINLTPILIASFERDDQKKECLLKLYNDGPNTVTDVRFIPQLREYDIELNTVVGAIYPKNLLDDSAASKIIKRIDPKREGIFRIAYSDMYNEAAFYGHNQKNSRIGIQVLFITYRREPDRALYYLVKYIKVGKTVNGEQFFLDLDWFVNKENVKIKEGLKKYEELFISNFPFNK